MPRADTLSVRAVPHGSPEYAATVALRDAILRRPLGLHFTAEQLAAEGPDTHLACYDASGALVGCLVLTALEAGTVKMRQVAVVEARQGTGVGRALVEESERVAAARGFGLMVLSARETAVPFYLRLGYERVGERYEEVTVPHYKMQKALRR